MKLLHNIRTLFRAPTIAEIIEHDLKAETTLLLHCEHAIKVAQFQRTLSIAKIRALKDWAEVELLNERMKNEQADS